MPKPLLKKTDGVLFAEWRMEQGHLVRSIRQPLEKSILDTNAELQKNEGALKDLEWAQFLGRIPLVTWYALCKKDPELNSRDPEIRTKAIMRLLQDRDYERLRVQPRSLARG